MNLFIAGGAGFIGANFAHLVRDCGYTAVVYDSLTYASNPEYIRDIRESKVKLIRGDIRDGEWAEELLRKGFRGRPFDAVVNFAAETHVDRSIKNALPFVESNVLGAVTLLEAARRANVPTFVQISTDEVYGSIAGMAKSSPDASLSPSSAYSASKAAADHLLMSYYHTHGYDVRITRCSNNYGPFQHTEKFIPTIIQSVLDRKPIPVYGDGGQIRDWIFVDDHCDGIMRVLEAGKPGGLYHFGGPEGEDKGGIPNIEIIDRILSLMSERLKCPKSELGKLIIHVEDRPGHDQRYALDWSATTKSLGWEPKVDLEKGLAETLDWYLSGV